MLIRSIECCKDIEIEKMNFSNSIHISSANEKEDLLNLDDDIEPQLLRKNKAQHMFRPYNVPDQNTENEDDETESQIITQSIFQSRDNFDMPPQNSNRSPGRTQNMFNRGMKTPVNHSRKNKFNFGSSQDLRIDDNKSCRLMKNMFGKNSSSKRRPQSIKSTKTGINNTAFTSKQESPQANPSKYKLMKSYTQNEKNLTRNLVNSQLIIDKHNTMGLEITSKRSKRSS